MGIGRLHADKIYLLESAIKNQFYCPQCKQSSGKCYLNNKKTYCEKCGEAIFKGKELEIVKLNHNGEKE